MLLQCMCPSQLLNTVQVVRCVLWLHTLLPPSTCEAGGPGDVQVEVLGSINEHVQVPVWLQEVGEGGRKAETTQPISEPTPPSDLAPPRSWTNRKHSDANGGLAHGG